MAGFPDRDWRHAAQSQVLPNDCAAKRIGIALHDGFALFDAAAVAEIFQSANMQDETTRSCVVRYDACLLSVTGDRISSSSSTLLWTETIDSHQDRGNIHALFIAGGTGVNAALRDGRLANWLRRIAANTGMIFPISERRQLFDATGLGLTAADPRRAASQMRGRNAKI